MGDRVVVIGAGLAGLAAASALAERGLQVTVLESRGRLGRRAGSFTDVASGQVLDACQHVSMGCCTNFAHFCRTVGVAHFFQTQARLYFMTSDSRVSPFAADRLPAPFHLARAFLGAHYLSPIEKCRVAWGLFKLRLTSADADTPFTTWLQRHRQTPCTIERFWNVVLTSALNESCDRVGLRYARKVFVDGFMSHRRGFEVELPTVPLDRLYGPELNSWFEKHDVRILLNQAVRTIQVREGRVTKLELRDGAVIEPDWHVAAVPFNRLLDLLPSEVIEAFPAFAGLRQLETSPITSIHLWYDAPITPLPHVVLIECIGQWLFNRGEVAAGEHYIQVVVSAARPFRGLGHYEVRRRITAELARLFPAAAAAKLLRARVVTEQAATFSAAPGVDRWRLPQASPLSNLLLAGDWTATGWPATMEGAVRSGFLAAEALLARRGTPERLLRPDL